VNKKALGGHWLVTVLWILLSRRATEDSYTDFRIIAESFYQNSGILAASAGSLTIRLA
jgi:hypothetical protein